jgi:DNA-binding winged helix-turn-helix (wHTH) protein
MRVLFGDCEVDAKRRELRRDGDTVHVEPQVFDLLLYLIENRDRAVSKDQLLAAVWKGRIISESALSTRINAARRAIGDSGDEQRLIKTIPRHGFRFVADVAEDRPRDAAAPTSQPVPPGLPERPSIAVMAFANTSHDADQGYFAEGMADDLIAGLSHIRWLK